MLAAPAMGILVAHCLAGLVEQKAGFGQHGHDFGIGFQHGLAGPQRHLGGVAAATVHGRVDFQPFGATHDIVLGAVAWSGVHQAGACLQCRVGREGQAEIALAAWFADKGVLIANATQGSQLVAGNFDPFSLGRDSKTAGVEKCLGQLARHDEVLASARAFDWDAGVDELRVGHHGQIGGQGPRRGCPDDQRGGSLAEESFHRRLVGHKREAHVDRRRVVVGVFHLSLGQRCLVGGAPVHRPLGAVEQPLSREGRQDAHDGGLVAFGQRQVGLVPHAHAAQAPEIGAHHVDELERVRLAALAELGGVQLGTATGRLFNLVLDGKTVTIPAGHEARALAHQELRTDDDVFENLVKQRAVVNPAGRVGRSVVQHESRCTSRFASCQQLLVVAFVGPAFEPQGLAAGQIGAHGEFGLGQAECVFPVHGSSDTSRPVVDMAHGRAGFLGRVLHEHRAGRVVALNLSAQVSGRGDRARQDHPVDRLQRVHPRNAPLH